MATSLPLGSLGLMTFAEFERMPDNGDRYELRNGEPVKVPPPLYGHKLIQRRLRRLLEAAAADAGEVDIEWGYRPTADHEYRIADVAFVSHERERLISKEGQLMGAPDLAAEVISPSNRRGAIDVTRRLCLQNGCREFWLIDPIRRRVSISTADGPDRIYHSGDMIPLLFGGSIEVNAIFA